MTAPRFDASACRAVDGDIRVVQARHLSLSRTPAVVGFARSSPFAVRPGCDSNVAPIRRLPTPVPSLKQCSTRSVCVSLRKPLTGTRSESGPVAAAKTRPSARRSTPGAPGRRATRASSANGVATVMSGKCDDDADDRPLQDPEPRRGSIAAEATPAVTSRGRRRRSERCPCPDSPASDARAQTAVSSASRGAKVGVTDTGISRPFAGMCPSVRRNAGSARRIARETESRSECRVNVEPEPRA